MCVGGGGVVGVRLISLVWLLLGDGAVGRMITHVSIVKGILYAPVI